MQKMVRNKSADMKSPLAHYLGYEKASNITLTLRSATLPIRLHLQLHKIIACKLLVMKMAQQSTQSR